MNNRKERVLFSAEEINNKNIELGKKISRDYEGKKLVAISLLREIGRASCRERV